MLHTPSYYYAHTNVDLLGVYNQNYHMLTVVFNRIEQKRIPKYNDYISISTALRVCGVCSITKHHSLEGVKSIGIGTNDFRMRSCKNI